MKEIGLVLAFLLTAVTAASADQGLEDPPISYGSPAVDNAIDRLQARLDRGEVTLQRQGEFAYLPALLRLLKIDIRSQTLVFSKTSFQQRLINPDNPRALYFGDDVYVGWVPGGPVIEVSAIDRKKGLIFYTLDLDEPGLPRFVRRDHECLQCHASALTHNVPGSIVRSVFPDRDGFPILSRGTVTVDHTTPLAQRWGGWFVTGMIRGFPHLGNTVYDKQAAPTPQRFDESRYPAGTSDLVALMVLEHQITVHNLITAADFAVREALQYDGMLHEFFKDSPAGMLLASTERRIADAVDPLVDALLMVGVAAIPDGAQGTGTAGNGFAAVFQTGGPRDHKGRSLRQLDLPGRLFRYPCSYLIQSAAFDNLPPIARDGVYRKLFDILSGRRNEPRYRHLTAPVRQAILEILRDTKPDLPGYFRVSRLSSAPAN